MSGIGKSYWSRQLRAVGFAYFGCDSIINEKLSKEIKPPIENFEDLNRWFGSPAEDTYERCSARYLAIESLVLEEIIAVLSADKTIAQKDVVIDTSGSAVYVNPVIWDQFRQQVRVVHLRMPEDPSSLLENFLKDPRPLIWNGLFQPKPGESITETYRRCYPLLLQQREQLYERYSAIQLAYCSHRQPQLTPERFLGLVSGSMVYA
jgi:shikimate kinase